MEARLAESSTPRNSFVRCFNKYHIREHQLPIEQDEEQEEVGSAGNTAADQDELFFQGHRVAENKIDSYLEEQGAGKSIHPLAWWRAKLYGYSTITRIARDHLTIPATSAASERMFSVRRDIITKKRNRLSPETMKQLFCLRSWGVYIKLEDSGDKEDEEHQSPQTIVITVCSYLVFRRSFNAFLSTTTGIRQYVPFHPFLLRTCGLGSKHDGLKLDPRLEIQTPRSWTSPTLSETDS